MNSWAYLPIVLAIVFGLATVWAVVTGRIGGKVGGSSKLPTTPSVAREIEIDPVYLQNDWGFVVVTGKITAYCSRSCRVLLAETTEAWLVKNEHELIRSALASDFWALSTEVADGLKPELYRTVIGVGKVQVELTFHNKLDSRAWLLLEGRLIPEENAATDDHYVPDRALYAERAERLQSALALLGKLSCLPAIELLREMLEQETNEWRKRELASTIKVLREVQEIVSLATAILSNQQSRFKEELPHLTRLVVATEETQDILDALADGDTGPVGRFFRKMADVIVSDNRRAQLLDLANFLALQASDPIAA